MKDVIIYSNGICNCYVCAKATLSVKEVTKAVNAINPTGIQSKWKKAKENFSSGETNPCVCNVFPETRNHYLFKC